MTDLTVRFLVTRTGAGTAEFLRLLATGIGDEEGTIIRDEQILDLLLRLLVNILLVVGNQTTGNGLADGVHLGDATTTANADADVNAGEFLLANDQKWLLEFESECLWLDLLQWFAIHLDESLAGLARGNGVGRLLAAIDLDGLWRLGGGGHFCD